VNPPDTREHANRICTVSIESKSRDTKYGYMSTTEVQVLFSDMWIQSLLGANN
jgi:hypothetical protein